MSYLMKFPRVYDDVYRYVKSALVMRENKVRSEKYKGRFWDASNQITGCWWRDRKG